MIEISGRERKKAERGGSGQEADAAARIDEVSGFRSLPRGNVLWSIATLNQRKSCGNLGGFKRGEIELFQLIRLKLTEGGTSVETWFVHRPSPSFSLSYLFYDYCPCSCDFSSSISFSSFVSLEGRLCSGKISREIYRDGVGFIFALFHSLFVPSPRWLWRSLIRERDWKSWFELFELLIEVSGLGRVQLFLYFLFSIVLRLLCTDNMKCQFSC